MKRVIIFAVAIALAGCANPDKMLIAVPAPEQQPLAERIPDEATRCKPEPDGSKVTTNRQSARYIVDLREAGADCRRKLSGVRSIIIGVK